MPNQVKPSATMPLNSVLPDCWDEDDSVDDLASQYDYCMVLNGGDNDGFDEYGRFAVSIMTLLGLELFIFKESQIHTADKQNRHPKMFVLIRAPIEELKIFCDRIDFPMLLDPTELEQACVAGDKQNGIAGFSIRHEPGESKLRPYDLIYGTYKYHTKGVPENLYWRPAGSSHPFREVVRLKLTQILIQEKPKSANDSIRLLKDIAAGRIVTFFPLQNSKTVERLAADMLKWNTFPWNENIEPVKEYFGEKIGLFFKFIAHQNTWIQFPALIGLGAQLVVFVSGDYSHPILAVFSALLLIWGIVMLEYWKRKEKFTALRWGQVGFESNETDRAEFKGVEMLSYMAGEDHTYFPTKTTRSRIATHAGLIVVVISSVLAAVVAIYVAKYLQILDQISASLINTAQIQIFNYLYGALADFLTEFENHRTDTKFQQYLISKLFLFQFVNSYASFIYLAFISEYIGQCYGAGCMAILATNLGILYGTRIVLSNVIGVLLPSLKYRASIHSRGVTMKTLNTIPRPEQEELRVNYNPIKDDITDNAEVVIQFGYMMLFATALPVAVTASAIFNLIKYKMNAYRLLRIYERPVPLGCEDIGVWQTIYFLINTVAVVCNAAIVVFTMNVLDDYGAYDKMWIFIGIILACYLIMYGMMEAIPDVPTEVAIQLHRMEFIVDKVIEKVADDVEEEMHEMPIVPIIIKTYTMSK